MKLKVNVRTVRKWVSRCCKKPSVKTSFENRSGQGRKRKLTKKQETQVVKKAKIKDEDAPQIAREMSKRFQEVSMSIPSGESLKIVVWNI